MFKQLLIFLFLLIISFNAFCQKVNSPDTIAIDDRIFIKVDNEAEFPGGMYAWRKYLETNLKTDIPVKKGAPAGTYKVMVRFVVARNGKITNIEAKTNHGYGMEKEVIRILKKGPKWRPAQLNGRGVNAYRIQPITFVVEEK